MWNNLIGFELDNESVFNKSATDLKVCIVDVKEGVSKSFDQYIEIYFQIIEGIYEGKIIGKYGIRIFNTPPVVENGVMIKKGSLWVIALLLKAIGLTEKDENGKTKVRELKGWDELIGKQLYLDVVKGEKYLNAKNFRSVAEFEAENIEKIPLRSNTFVD